MFPNPWQSGGLPFLNIASTSPATRTLGPGVRAAVWVQGCSFNCPDCIAPEWIPRRISRLVKPEHLVAEILSATDITGLTFSGGEPMLQAAGLAKLVRIARQYRELSLICFTGFTLEQLRQQPPGPGVTELLAEIDILIDGQYIAARNDNRGMRGSDNQRIHYLTTKIKRDNYDFEGGSRKAEIHLGDGYAMLVGVPSFGMSEAFRHAVGKANATLLSGVKDRELPHKKESGG